MADRTELNMRVALSQLQKQIASSDTAIADPTQVTSAEFDTLGSKLHGYFDAYCTLATEYLKGLGDSKYEKETRAHAGIRGQVIDMLAELSTNQNKAVLDTSLGTSNAYAHAQSDANVSATTSGPRESKLPFLRINFYDGDPMKWAEFWDSFKTTIHDRTNLSGVEKFKYLQSYLKGDAQLLVSGYQPSNDSYETAVEHLKDRFGDPERIEQAHISELLAMPVSGTQNYELRKTLDKCEQHIRCLVSLGLKEENFGRFFAPIMLSKFPYPMQVELNRAKAGKAWTLSELRSRISWEIGAREGGLRNFGQQLNTRPQHPQQSNVQSRSFGPSNRTPPRTTSAFPVHMRSPKECVYCGRQHYSDECTTYADIASRLSRIKDRCKRCLSKEHASKNCRSEKACAYCNYTNHHRSICRKRFPESSVRNGPTRSQFTVHAAACEREATSAQLGTHAFVWVLECSCGCV